MQGGARFVEPTVITDRVKHDIEELEVLAPLHNPANLAGIVSAERAFPDVPHVAVFDTAFHQTLPPAAFTYAIDRELAAKHRVRRYGFHGTSHRFVSRAAAEYLCRPVEELRMRPDEERDVRRRLQRAVVDVLDPENGERGHV